MHYDSCQQYVRKKQHGLQSGLIYPPEIVLKQFVVQVAALIISPQYCSVISTNN